MFLRHTDRFKDGKRHRYWSVVESVRVGRRTFKRQAIYLGELNDSQKAGWMRTVEAFGEQGAVEQLKLFPADNAPKDDDGCIVRIKTEELRLENMRNWGEVWMGMELWNRLELDRFWEPRLDRSRKDTDWLALLKAIVMYRFTDPGSEWRMHRDWLRNTAVEELIGTGALTGKSTLYAALDHAMYSRGEWLKPKKDRNGFKDEFFCFLRDKWANMFHSTRDVVLFDLTSTYFEVDGTKALDSDLQRYGYSRDKRGDCLQVVIALVLTPDGFPLSYEVLPGNTNDKETQMLFIRKLEAKYCKIGNLWLMDRGVPTEKTLKMMRDGGYKYLVGSPRGHVKALGKKLEAQEWEEVQDGIEVKIAEEGDERFILTRSEARTFKETAMRMRKIRAVMKTLFAIDGRIGRSKWRMIEPSRRQLTRDELIGRLEVAKSKAGRAFRFIEIVRPKEGEKVTTATFRWKLDWDAIRKARNEDEGTYLLRTNLADCDPKTLWKKYMLQGEIEQAFKELKNDLGLRPVHHQLETRIEAHIFTAFMALCLQATLKAIAHEHAPGLTPRQIVDKMKTIKMIDVKMPTTDGRTVTLPRYVEPKEDVALILSKLGFALPKQPPPKISAARLPEKK